MHTNTPSDFIVAEGAGYTIMRQPEPGHDLPHHRVADTDAVRLLRPGPQIVELALRHGLHPLAQRISEWLQAKRDTAPLQAGARIAKLPQTGANFGHVGGTDTEPGRNLA